VPAVVAAGAVVPATDGPVPAVAAVTDTDGPLPAVVAVGTAVVPALNVLFCFCKILEYTTFEE
jgi:hypothetical protein